MSWKGNNYATIHDCVNANTHGHADSILHPNSTENYFVQNTDVVPTWLSYYIQNNIRINIVGDFDADGECATRAAFLTCSALGATDVRIFIPERADGYGMNTKIVDAIEYGVVLCVDNGIAANEAVAAAKAKGLVVIIVDHHEPRMDENGQIMLPEADLIVDPHVDDSLIANGPLYGSNFDGYCATGLMYKIACFAGLPENVIDEIAVLAAIATVTDVMELVEDNRNIFWKGVQVIKKRKLSPGLTIVFEDLNSDYMVSEEDIAFKIGPTFNAPERVLNGGAMMVINLLNTNSYSEARMIYATLKNLNEQRKVMKEEAVGRALNYIDENCLYGINPIVIYDPLTQPGIVGLVAGEITERFGVSSFVFTDSPSDANVIKASARAYGDDNIKESLELAKQKDASIFIGFGGHKGAAGLSIYKDRLGDFEALIDEIMPPANQKTDDIVYDMEIKAGDIVETTNEVLKYAPFGQGNPAITFCIKNFKLVPINNTFFAPLGANTIKLFGAGCEAIGFSMLNRYQKDNYPKEIDLVGKLSYHYFMGKVTPQIEIVDYKPVIREKVQSDLSKEISNVFASVGIKA